jgi:tRNA-dihydrouridine synthase A
VNNQNGVKAPYISVAPMLDWTDRHCRYFHRLLSPNAHLYSEMITTGALIHGDPDRHLRMSKAEHPVALQLGGNNPKDLAVCAKMGEDYGYNEINLNCGCPSDRVQNGAFGACLMDSPAIVAECVSVMREAVNVPVTVKCRIGIDHVEEEPFLEAFLREVSAAGCTRFVVHARKAWLKGLSPKENREIPPLRYDIVEKMYDKFPDLTLILNGGIKSVEDVQNHLRIFDGVMVGREAYQNPWVLTEFESTIFGTSNLMTRDEVALAMIPYIEEQNALYGTPAKSITRHILGLYNGLSGAKAWRRALSEQKTIEEAMSLMKRDEKLAA